jgi:hypothetical protein
MAYYVGLDVSVKETSICIMEDKGDVAARTDILTDPDLIARFIFKHASKVDRVVHESACHNVPADSRWSDPWTGSHTVPQAPRRQP